MSLLQWITATFFKALTGLIFRVDAAQLAKVPRGGPLIIVANHVHIPEIPTLYTRLLPRKMRGMVQAERVFDRNIVGAILRWIGTIPVWRGEADLNALRMGIQVLAEGNILLLDPEGTRSHNGCLQKGRPGAILIALHSGAPMLPVVHYGSENYPENLKRLRRTDLHYVVGKPFRVDAGGQRVTSAIRQQMIDEVMFQMAGLLPLQYRGAYADLNNAPHKYLKFVE
ncbi:MAG: lysophospholipid acyltransferase family protein [Anaerolineales bacterium]|jgi:1-acyl-sn-glycerol-3-phosphate acyltransferase